jgi:N-acetylmuramoyl-L-alanine amidase
MVDLEARILAIETFLGLPAYVPPPPSERKTYTVKRGDTLNKISASTGIPVLKIAEINKISNANFIKVGQVLYLEEEIN